MDPILKDNDLPSWENLTIRNPFPPTRRSVSTPTVLTVDDDMNLLKMEGIRHSSTHSKITKDIKTFGDVVDFVIQGGTCYLSCHSDYLTLLLKPLSEDDLLTLMFDADPAKGCKIGDVTVTRRSGSITFRRGNEWGRVYSMWVAYPKNVADELDPKDPMPLPLDTLDNIFLDVMVAGIDEGVPLDTLASAGSVAQSMLLTQVPGLFGRLGSVDPIHIERAHQCYKGGRFEAGASGTIQKGGTYYDMISAIPYALSELIPPFEPYTRWIDKSEYIKEAYYGFAKCLILPDPNLGYSPVLVRLYNRVTGTKLVGANICLEAWVTKPEMDEIIDKGLAKLVIEEGSWGIPNASAVHPVKGLMNDLYRLRQHPILGRLAKTASQTVGGKLGSTWVEEADLVNGQPVFKLTTSPVFLIMCASHANGKVRADVLDLALRTNATAIRSDGVVTTRKYNIEDLKFGGVKEKSNGMQLVLDDIMYGASYIEYLMTGDLESTSFSIVSTSIINERLAVTMGNPKDGWKHLMGRIQETKKQRHLGTKKRINNISPTKSNHLKGLVPSTPIKTRDDLEEVRLALMRLPYDYT